jgi:plastocyanin
MRFSTVAATLAAAASVSAQTTYNVIVGANLSVTYTPNVLTGVNVGDTIAFTFASKDHTVTQSSFGNPCSNLSADPTKYLDSGFFPVPANPTELPQWSFNVTNTTVPLWFYCRQVGHCQKGMVFAINPTVNKTFAAFQTLANHSVSSNTTNGGAITGTNAAGATGGAGGSSGTSTSGAAGTTSTPGSGASVLSVSAAGLLGVAGVMSILL